MPIGLAAGLAIGAVGGYTVSCVQNHVASGSEDEATNDAGAYSGAAEAATLEMPGLEMIKPHDLTSLGGSSSLISALLHQLWPQINKIGIKAVQESVEPMFQEKLPTAFQKMHFRTLDLGKEPIKLDNFVVHPVLDTNNTLCIELEINWDSTCDILLAGLPANQTIGIKSIKIRSRLVIVCRPILDVAPVISSAQVAFINQPFIDLDFTGIANVADFGGIRPMVSTMVVTVMYNSVPCRSIFVLMCYCAPT